VSGFDIALDDPSTPDVRALLEVHRAFSYANSPPEDVHVMDIDALQSNDVSFFSCREDGALLGVGALKRLDDRHAELKSMHTAEAARRRGVARALVDHLLRVARERGFSQISIETGALDAYAAARALYIGAGFQPCAPFADYCESPNSTFMTLALGSSRA
jgi:putative acetyltransferase